MARCLLFIGTEASHLPDHVLQELAVLGEASLVPVVSLSPVALVDAHGHGVPQNHGCCSLIAIMTGSMLFCF